MKITLLKKNRIVVPAIVVLSVVVPLLVLILMYLPERNNILGIQSGTLPLFHAMLNASTSILLIIGYFFMSVKKYKSHRNVMISAFFLSVIFLVSYVISKMSNDPVSFGGEGAITYVYYFILITHILLSAVIIPLVLFTMYRGLTGDFYKHAKIARWTFPIWLYVTVTGVLVYIFMWPYY